MLFLNGNESLLEGMLTSLRRLITSGDEAEVRVRIELLSERLLSLLELLNLWLNAPKIDFRLGRFVSQCSVVADEDEIDEDDVDAEVLGVIKFTALTKKKYIYKKKLFQNKKFQISKEKFIEKNNFSFKQFFIIGNKFKIFKF